MFTTTQTPRRLDDLDRSRAIVAEDVVAVREDSGRYTIYSYSRSGAELTELAHDVKAAEAFHVLDEIDVLDLLPAEAQALAA
ncbi:MAG: hypothetical protein H0U42_01640 [Thermoleophilaceae bacterium]|nr:hypothetical protein [Thermoleophilaceae bacterium]